MTRLFVYGTLKRGCKNHHHLAGQIYVGEARTVAGYRLYDLGDYPGMVAAPDDTEGVTGELWLADEAALAHLDDFEGVHEGLYHRVPVALLNMIEPGSVHTYLYARPTAGRPAIGPMWCE